MLDLANYTNNQEVPNTIKELCGKYQAYPLKLAGNRLDVAVVEFSKPEHIATLKFSIPYQINIIYLPQAEMDKLFNLDQTSLSADANNIKVSERNSDHNELQEYAPAVLSNFKNNYELDASEDENTLLVWIDEILVLAIDRQASDIHFEPYPQKGRVRLRVDGVLTVIREYEAKDALRLTTRLKILGDLDIAERRLPQDGQLKTTIHHRIYTMRISTLPTQYGEKIVLRILQSDNKFLSLSQLGMNQIQQTHYESALAAPQGLILVTGPTGSGKTVTLYAGLSKLNSPEKNICSVEDPVELPLYGINQTQTNTKTDLNFANVLRAFLRQDPDILMIGEIRDSETAEIAIKAAQTGHLVLSTLHTNSTAETIVRLKQMDIPGYLIASSLKLIIAQRLIRKLCERCKSESTEVLILPDELSETLLNRSNSTHYEANGCVHCFNGYQGRVGIYEFLLPNNELKVAITNQVSAEDIVKLQVKHNQPRLIEQAFELVMKGITSLEEVYRVIGGNNS